MQQDTQAGIACCYVQLHDGVAACELVVVAA